MDTVKFITSSSSFGIKRPIWHCVSLRRFCGCKIEISQLEVLLMDTVKFVTSSSSFGIKRPIWHCVSLRRFCGCKIQTLLVIVLKKASLPFGDWVVKIKVDLSSAWTNINNRGWFKNNWETLKGQRGLCLLVQACPHTSTLLGFNSQLSMDHCFVRFWLWCHTSITCESATESSSWSAMLAWREGKIRFIRCHDVADCN